MEYYTRPNDARGNKALIAAQYTGADLGVKADFKFPVGCRNKQFKGLNPVGKVPVLVTPEGPIFESNSILRFVARAGKKLYGSSDYEASLVDQWLDFAQNEIQLPGDAWLYPIWEYVPNNAEATNKAKSDIRRVMSVLNGHLATRTFVVGERLSIADIGLVCALYPLYVEVLDNKTRKPFGNVNRWYKTCINQPEFKKVLGTLAFCEKMRVAPAAPAAAAAKPAAKPAAAPAKKKAKKKDEFAELPKTNFDLEEWKRIYSNQDTKTEAMPWFWKNYDAAGWSLWWSDYKYNDECEKLFMTSNLIGGYCQRLDRLRKYGFGNLLIFGEEPKLEVSCVWLFRGTKVPQVMKDCDDSENYTWKQVNVEDPKEKALVGDYFAWEGDFGGKVFKDNGKVFK